MPNTYCTACDGSGEGLYEEGTRCRRCKGLGSQPDDYDDPTDAELEYAEEGRQYRAQRAIACAEEEASRGA